MLIVCGYHDFKAHQGRVDGFCTKLGELGIGSQTYTVVESHNDYNITYEKITASLNNDPHIKGIYMANESVSGCVDAIRNTKISGIHVVYHDLSTTTAAYLKEGTVDFVIKQIYIVKVSCPSK
jgi:LacI family transcriptional regulator